QGAWGQSCRHPTLARRRGDRMKERRTSSLPGLTRQSVLLRKKMDARVTSAFTRVFDALLPAHDGVRRREMMLALAAAAAWPLAARAQQRERVRRIAWLGAGRADEPSPYLESLRAGLRDAGWSEGRNLTIAPFWATGLDNVEAVGRELLASDPEVIVAQEFTVLGLRSLKVTKPVVFGFSGDQLDVQLVESWGRPGGNFTGMSYLAIELVGKRIELIKEWLPQTRRIAVLARPQHPGEPLERKASEEAAAKLGLELSYFPYTSRVLPT